VILHNETEDIRLWRRKLILLPLSSSSTSLLTDISDSFSPPVTPSTPSTTKKTILVGICGGFTSRMVNFSSTDEAVVDQTNSSSSSVPGYLAMRDRIVAKRKQMLLASAPSTAGTSPRPSSSSSSSSTLTTTALNRLPSQQMKRTLDEYLISHFSSSPADVLSKEAIKTLKCLSAASASSSSRASATAFASSLPYLPMYSTVPMCFTSLDDGGLTVITPITASPSLTFTSFHELCKTYHHCGLCFESLSATLLSDSNSASHASYFLSSSSSIADKGFNSGKGKKPKLKAVKKKKNNKSKGKNSSNDSEESEEEEERDDEEEELYDLSYYKKLGIEINELINVGAVSYELHRHCSYLFSKDIFLPSFLPFPVIKREETTAAAEETEKEGSRDDEGMTTGEDEQQGDQMEENGEEEIADLRRELLLSPYCYGGIDDASCEICGKSGGILFNISFFNASWIHHLPCFLSFFSSNYLTVHRRQKQKFVDKENADKSPTVNGTENKQEKEAGGGFQKPQEEVANGFYHESSELSNKNDQMEVINTGMTESIEAKENSDQNKEVYVANGKYGRCYEYSVREHYPTSSGLFRCMICGVKQGIILRCCAIGCSVRAHLICASFCKDWKLIRIHKKKEGQNSSTSGDLLIKRKKHGLLADENQENYRRKAFLCSVHRTVDYSDPFVVSNKLK
jgi:hypothetical protein